MINKVERHYPQPIKYNFLQKNKGHFVPFDRKQEDWLVEHAFIREPFRLGFCPLHLQQTNELKDKYQGQIGYIIGKGPSLDRLSFFDFSFDTAPVIGVNEAYLKAKELHIPNPIYFAQCDLPCAIYVVEPDPILCMHNTGHFYFNYSNVFVIDWDISISNLTSILAVQMMKYFGVKHIYLKCFDALKGIDGYSNWMKDKVNYTTCPNHVRQSEKVKIALEKYYPGEYTIC